MNASLTEVESHFKFGENWQSFARLISQEQIAEAVGGLQKLFRDGELRGKHFLDIGCGSGLSMLAALQLGASHATGIDIDEDSVGAAQSLLSRFAPEKQWSVSKRSVFDLEGMSERPYDVIHSWGVLHHTGNMWRAMEIALASVPADGFLALALYRKRPFCALWRAEKRVYRALPAWGQWPLRATYKAAFLSGQCVLGRNPVEYVRNYKLNRGMDWNHDVHDWLGGYPYESVSEDEIGQWLAQREFKLVRSHVTKSRGLGLFGSGCDEFVARRSP